MKILQINTCHYRRGGADVVYLNTSQLLVEKGHEVINFSQNSPRDVNAFDKKYFIDNIDYFGHSPLNKMLTIPRFFYSKEAKQKIEELVKVEKPDIAHVHSYKGILTPSILYALKKNNVPVVITLHDYGLLCPHNSFLNGKNEICEKCLTTNNFLHCIINRCNRDSFSLSTVTALEYFFHKKIFPFDHYFEKLIAVSKFGMRIHARKPEFKEKLVHLYNFYPKLNLTKPNSEKGQYFLCYGRISREKGIISLLKAWRLINKSQKLKIVGEGRMMQEVLLYIKENNLYNVEVLGFKTGIELEQLINNASFIVVPSEWYENNPLTIIEAYSNGKPVIASKVGGISEIIIENETGYIFEMGNIIQLSEVLKKSSEISNDEYIYLSENARRFSEKHFAAEAHYENLMTIYNSVLH